MDNAISQSLFKLNRQGFAIALPIFLIPCMWAVFQIFARLFEHPLGYLLSMLVYWVVWCTLLPLALVGGWSGFLDLFRPMPSLKQLGWKTSLLLGWPLIFPLVFMVIPKIAATPLIILAASVVNGVLIGVTEEVLWRGVYLRLFPQNRWLNLLYPSLMFALWHIAPLSVVVNRMPGGVFSFLAYALLLGLSYGVAARRTGSIAWPTISHVLHDSLGLSGFMYAVWLLR